MSAPPRLALAGIVKRYPGVLANDRVSLEVAPGEIHGLIGENGAGKSTLVKIIYGAMIPDEGEVRWEGRSVRIQTPSQARRLGINLVFQHFMLFDTLTVAENVALSLGSSADRGRIARDVSLFGERYGLPLDPLREVHTLSVGERQRVEIIRCLLQRPRLLIMDEPTSVLTPQAVERLFGTLRQLAAEGVSILYISHKLEEVRSLCSRVTVLRGGRVSGVCDPREASVAELSRMMIGAELPAAASHAKLAGEPLLVVRDLSVPARSHAGVSLQGVNLQVRAGEILGIAGVSGNGQNELLSLVAGEDRRASAGRIFIGGDDVSCIGVAGRRTRGLAFVPEERLGRGAVPEMGLGLNTLLTHDERSNPGLVRHGLISTSGVTELAERILRQFGVRAAGPRATARSLSGGNLQKFIIGRELSKAPRVLVVAQPTWGVDVGAASQIRREIAKLASEGAAVLVVSEELDELLELCDTLQVMAGGSLSEPMPARNANVERIGVMMGSNSVQTSNAAP